MVRAALILAVVVAGAPGWAAQSLIPTPYPGSVGGGTPLDPEMQERGAPQELMRDPYPRIMGDDSQGNPPIVRTHRRQRPIPSVNERKYRVDRH